MEFLRKGNTRGRIGCSSKHVLVSRIVTAGYFEQTLPPIGYSTHFLYIVTKKYVTSRYMISAPLVLYLELVSCIIFSLVTLLIPFMVPRKSRNPYNERAFVIGHVYHKYRHIRVLYKHKLKFSIQENGTSESACLFVKKNKVTSKLNT